jgi:hypothetical protein
MKMIINNNDLDKYINLSIENWANAKKANIDDTVNNFAYWYEGGETPEYTEVDYLNEEFQKNISQLKHYKSEIEFALDRINHALDSLK